ncbi:hypothetical protein HK104_000851 [Borealophlyctis nickersoniae]|nr:hypothetical protein HK104_000851 [Borealophlyctis nickersoniae]
MNQYKSRAKDLVQAIQPINDMRDMEAICDKLLEVEDIVKMENHLNCLKIEKLLNDFTKEVMAQKDLKAEENDQIPSEEEQKHYIPWNELTDKVCAYRDRLLSNVEGCTTEELENACITGLYVIDHEPRRNEYGSLTYDEDGENVYVDGKITLRDYKTFAAYGQYEFALSDETKILMDELKEGSLIYTKERVQLAKKMGHSIGEQQKVYTLRFEPSPSIEEDAERSEDVSSAPTGSKRKREEKRFWADQEVAELRGLLSEKGNNPRAILDEAVARNLMMARRDVKRIRNKLKMV